MTSSLPPLGETLALMRLVWAVDHALQRRSKRMQIALGVTGPQRLVVRIVGRFPSITAGQLASLLELHPSTLTCIVKGLVRRKLITRTPDPRDTRRILLGLTAKGREVDHAKEGTIEEAVELLLTQVPPDKLGNTREVLLQLAQGLNSV
jgi:MarR family transcriptional regulator, organic hydroperoxide resistance regulator